MTKILFVCHGNICRSPMAEWIMKAHCRQAGVSESFEISSSAVSTEEIGNDIYPPAKMKLREKGIPFSRHSARQVTRADYSYYDYIVCADRSNLRWLERIVGEDKSGKVSMLMEWCGESRDVSDPWYTGDFEAAYQDIESATRAIVEQLSPSTENVS